MHQNKDSFKINSKVLACICIRPAIKLDNKEISQNKTFKNKVQSETVLLLMI